MKHALKLLESAIDKGEASDEEARDYITALNVLRDTMEFNKARRIQYFCQGQKKGIYEKQKQP